MPDNSAQMKRHREITGEPHPLAAGEAARDYAWNWDPTDWRAWVQRGREQYSLVAEEQTYLARMAERYGITVEALRGEIFEHCSARLAEATAEHERKEAAKRAAEEAEADAVPALMRKEARERAKAAERARRRLRARE